MRWCFFLLHAMDLFGFGDYVVHFLRTFRHHPERHTLNHVARNNEDIMCEHAVETEWL
jgi:hypothetical protein